MNAGVREQPIQQGKGNPVAEDEEFVEPGEGEEEAQQIDSSGITALRKAHKNLSNENAALKLQVEQLGARQRALDLTDVVRKKNLAPKIIDVIPGDIAVEDVEAWLDDHADIFKPTQAAKRAKPPSPEQAAAARESQFRMDQLEGSAQLSTGEQSQIAEVNAAASGWKTIADMREFFHEKGAW